MTDHWQEAICKDIDEETYLFYFDNDEIKICRQQPDVKAEMKLHHDLDKIPVREVSIRSNCFYFIYILTRNFLNIFELDWVKTNQVDYSGLI